MLDVTSSALILRTDPADMKILLSKTTENCISTVCSDPEKERVEQEAKRLAEVEVLEDALDALCETGRKFLGRYTILSSVERRGGGQGVVQFAQVVGSAELVAIKFFNRVEVCAIRRATCLAVYQL